MTRADQPSPEVSGRGVLLPVEEVGCAEWLIVEDRAAWLECAIFSRPKGTSRLSEGHLKGRRLLDWLCGQAEAPWARAQWWLGLLGQRRAVRQLWAERLGGGWSSHGDARRWEDRFFLGVPLVDYFCRLLFVLFPSQSGH